MLLQEPGRECPLCPRLVAFRTQWRAAEPTWFNAPVPGFGPQDARLLIVGLAPGLRGANRTGRPFTGDYAGDLLYDTLIRFGFASGTYRADPNDGLTLHDAHIVNAVRCVPPENKPTTDEIRTCRPFLIEAMAAMPRLTAILALGKIAHDSTVVSLGERMSRAKFGHGSRHEIGGYTLFGSYHCSRYNTNTGVLTPEMFRAVFSDVRAFLDKGAS
ncbi:uracil-DNA glycosylase [Azorhizobium oxalatiphilum]|uniref:Type-5 uracil-DNA glycosylase n=1 Tax=Azorhizobium oxalatiphilum TaxID=980631 RepID=A0A917C6F6_9HYPH|nr:uracil-DNA glycosylase [Azorhizobium oxalatiphilum]GGF74376.1 uracil-DNA glycosylase [Azorhizobium oxalatiphilum]